ncbi:unnamed protein product [Ostreobium quekettii]|uniref:Peptidase S1 domain-containing protein n=1 Tax=Ostreobium quekettii TaxID=121088 RepID=A0A8S1J7W7_9CHLO|nr:unnamed protein product [Ostreobium quekettii]
MAASAWAALALMICVACRGVWASGGGASGSQVAENGINWEDAAALQRQLLIADGRDAPCEMTRRFPYMASLRNANGTHACGAVLVDSLWLVTAAHCVDPQARNTVGRTPVAVIGACQLEDAENDDEAEVVQVETSIMHPMYTGDLLNGYDVALLKLSEASEKSFPVLPEKDDDTLSSENLVVLGWGQQRDGTMADFLQMADEVDIIPPVLCTSSDSWGSFIDPDQMICAMGFQGQDVCTGDGGGPLVSAFAPEGVIEDGVPVVDIVLGVVSFAEADKACGEQKLPTVFARLSGVREWIVSTMATR